MSKESNTLLFKWHNHFTQIPSHGIKQYKDKLFLPTTTPEANRPLPSPPVPPDKKYLGLSLHLEYLQDIPIPGQDPRLLVVDDDTILSVFTNTNRFVRPGIATLSLNYSTNTLQVQHIIRTVRWKDSSSEKNWVPFAHDTSSTTTSEVNEPVNQDALSKVLFIQQINPLVVVRIADPSSHQWESAEADAEIVSEAPRGYFSYHYGDLRGGTNAIDIGDRYLAVFHSSVMLPRAATKIYFMGAFTFTKDPPFRLLSVSSEPMVVPWMYEDNWNPFVRNRKIDYCLFPVSFSFLPAKQHDTRSSSSSSSKSNAALQTHA
jgi:hypothetical protein